MRYVRLTTNFADKGKLVPHDKVWDFIKNDKEHYVSTYYYNDKHFEQFQKTGSVKGIRDVVADKIWFDFDNKENPALAQADCLTVVERLKRQGIPDSDIQVFFSGQKGNNIVVDTKQTLTPEEVARVTEKLAGDLKTFDLSLYDASQIMRVPGTKHQASGLYKIPLTIPQLTKDISQIREMAKDLSNVGDFQWGRASLPPDLLKAPPAKKNTPAAQMPVVGPSNPPYGWKAYKWALVQGNFESGERHNALMVVAATCRGLGYDKNTTYYICKTAIKNQAAISGADEFPKEELFKNIIEESVFSDGWEGGSYSPKTNPWLRKYCERMGFKWEDDIEENPCVSLDDMTQTFSSYAQNFEQNIIKTGLVELDNNLILSTSTLNGLLGQPGAGKTSVCLNILRHTAKNNIPSIFFSLDMGLPLIYSKLVQKETGYDFKRAMDVYRNNSDLREKVSQKIKEDYKNVSFNFKSGVTVADIKKIKRAQEELSGKKIRLCVIDYLECIASPFSDATAGAAFIANQLKDLANEEEMCVLLLLQTQKHSTADISDPLLSMKQIKGSSVIEQACSTILTLWREGYSPKTVNDDRYLSFAVVKNRFGSLWSGDFSWNGVTGDVSSLTQEQVIQLDDFKQRKFEAKMKLEKESKAQWD